MFLITIGALIFIGLYVPLILQVQKECEISQFETVKYSFEVHYGEGGSTGSIYSMNKPALVTFVQATSTCESASPVTLLLILVIGAILTILLNILYIHAAYRAVNRSCHRRHPLEKYPSPCRETLEIFKALSFPGQVNISEIE